MDGIRKGVNGVGVVEWLSTQSSEELSVSIQGRAVIDVGIWLNDPDEFFTGVVEVQFDFVGRGTDGFITSELNLFNEVFVRVLCHFAAFIGVQEDVVDVEGCSDQGLLVSSGDGNSSL